MRTCGWYTYMRLLQVLLRSFLMILIQSVALQIFQTWLNFQMDAVSSACECLESASI